MRRRLLLLLLVVALGAVACSDGGSDGPSASLTTPPSTEVPTVEEEVEAAYLRSWDVYAEAMLELDPGGLSDSYATPQLERTRADVLDRKSDGRPVRITVEHDYRIAELRDDSALVVDRYRNHSVLLDPDSKDPVEPDPNELIVEQYTLRKVSGEWKVVDIARSQS
jgi:hypothetical protein